MAIIRERFAGLFSLVILQWLIYFICIFPSQGTDFFDDWEKPQGTRLYRHNTIIQDEPIGSLSTAITAPISGKVVALSVLKGQKVKKGEHFCTVEVMKMEFNKYSPFSGQIHSTFFAIGDYITQDTTIMILSPPETMLQPLNTPPNKREAKEAEMPTNETTSYTAHIPQRALAFPWLFADNLAPIVLSTLNTPSPFSFSSSVFPRAIKAFSVPINPDVPSSNAKTQNSQMNTPKTQLQPSAPLSPKTSSLVPSLNEENSFFKRKMDRDLRDPPQANSFFQRLPNDQNVSGYSIVACAKWIGGLIAIAQFLFVVKTIFYYILGLPSMRRISYMVRLLPETAYLRSIDFNKYTITAYQQVHNMNRTWHSKRKVA